MPGFEKTKGCGKPGHSSTTEFNVTHCESCWQEVWERDIVGPRRVEWAAHRMLAVLKEFADRYGYSFDAGADMSGADTVENLGQFWNDFVKPAIELATGKPVRA